MIYHARTESNEMFIAMYETEEPNKLNYYDSNNKLIEPDWTSAYNFWQSSKREYKVRELDVLGLKVLLQEEWKRNIDRGTNNCQGYFESLEKGIDCTFLKDRLKVNRILSDDGEILGREWTLLPLEDKKENQGDIMSEFVTDYFYNEQFMSPSELMAFLESKYIITRKPNIQEPE